MKRIITVVVLAGVMAVSTGCYGSFQLTKKIYDWNGQAGNKYVNSALFWVFNIIPVYGVSAFIDAVALNVIEFWSGSNPIAFQSETEMKKVVSTAGKTYEVTMGRGTITILETAGPDAGKWIALHFDPVRAEWSLSDPSGARTTIAEVNPKPVNTISLIYPDGSTASKPISSLN